MDSPTLTITAIEGGGSLVPLRKLLDVITNTNLTWRLQNLYIINSTDEDCGDWDILGLESDSCSIDGGVEVSDCDLRRFAALNVNVCDGVFSAFRLDNEVDLANIGDRVVKPMYCKLECIDSGRWIISSEYSDLLDRFHIVFPESRRG